MEEDAGKIHLQKMVYKSNPLLHGSYTLSNRQQRILAILASNIDHREDGQLNPVYLPAHSLFEALGLQDTNKRWKMLEDDLADLMSRVVRQRSEDGKTVTLSHFVSAAKLDQNTKKVKLAIHEESRQFYLDLSARFTRYELGSVMKFRGTYTLRFYEWFKEKEFTKGKSGWWYVNIELSDLRRKLDLEPKKGQTKPKYPRWDSLRDRVVDPSIEELRDLSPWQINWEAIKYGRAVGELKFHIGPKKTRTTAKAGSSSPKPKKKPTPTSQPDLGLPDPPPSTTYAQEVLLPKLQKASEKVQNYYKGLQGERINKAKRNEEEISEEAALIDVLQHEPGVLLTGEIG